MSNELIIKEHHVAFQLSRTEIYEVNIEPNIVLRDKQTFHDGTFHFSTTAEIFNRPKTDFNQCGQCQEGVTKNHPAANAHWKKWDRHHLEQVTPELYEEWLQDLWELKAFYNYIERDRDTTFNELRALSMEEVKKQPKK